MSDRFARAGQGTALLSLVLLKTGADGRINSLISRAGLRMLQTPCSCDFKQAKSLANKGKPLMA